MRGLSKHTQLVRKKNPDYHPYILPPSPDVHRSECVKHINSRLSPWPRSQEEALSMLLIERRAHVGPLLPLQGFNQKQLSPPSLNWCPLTCAWDCIASGPLLKQYSAPLLLTHFCLVNSPLKTQTISSRHLFSDISPFPLYVFP